MNKHKEKRLNNFGEQYKQILYYERKYLVKKYVDKCDYNMPEQYHNAVKTCRIIAQKLIQDNNFKNIDEVVRHVTNAPGWSLFADIVNKKNQIEKKIHYRALSKEERLEFWKHVC